MKNLIFLLIFILGSITPTFSAPSYEPPITHVHPVSETVYVTKTGAKYHKSSCHYLKKSKIKTTKSTAKSSGYSACSVCKP